ncbi:hypothetical protein PM082_011741 [Marasmius tenuissimus]|nr:hypothetical protein PM082_011741 [Marasmius tenuissimus]
MALMVESFEVGIYTTSISMNDLNLFTKTAPEARRCHPEAWRRKMVRKLRKKELTGRRLYWGLWDDKGAVMLEAHGYRSRQYIEAFRSLGKTKESTAKPSM